MNTVTNTIFLIVQIGLIINWLMFNNKFLNFGERDAFQNFVIINLNLWFIFIVFRISSSEISKRSLRSAVDEIKELISDLRDRGPNARALSQDEFYSEFPSFIARANKSVDIAYLDTKPPTSYAIGDSVTSRYYKDFIDMVRKRKDVEFRRVERYSTEKVEWFKLLITRLEKRDNFSLSVIKMDAVERKIPELSVQIIDGKEVFLVAVAEHENTHGYRDVQISDSSSSSLFMKYYDDMLWNRGGILIEKGKLNTEFAKELGLQR